MTERPATPPAAAPPARGVDAVTFPVLLSPRQRREHPMCPRAVPWAMVAHGDAQASQNHYQSLARLAARGGLDPVELLAVIDGRAYPRAAVEADPAAAMRQAAADLFRRVAAFSRRAGVVVAGSVAVRPAWRWLCPFCDAENFDALPAAQPAPVAVSCRFCQTAYTPVVESASKTPDQPGGGQGVSDGGPRPTSPAGAA